MRPIRRHQPSRRGRLAAPQPRVGDHRRRFPVQRQADLDLFLGQYRSPLENAAATGPDNPLNRGKTAMRLSSWLRMLTSHKQTVDRPPPRRRLVLEALEDRSLLSGTTFTPVVTASIHDEPRDGQGDSFNTVFDSLLGQAASAEDRAVAEFDLESVAAGPVNLAVLDFSLAVNGQGTPLRTFDVYVYAGNGQGDLADFSA